MATLAVTMEQVYNQMVALGFFKYFLPWLLAFVVIYGILRSIDLFSTDGNGGPDAWHTRLYGVMAAIIATLIVAYVPFQTGAYATFLSTYFGSISLILLILVGFVLIYGLLTGKAPHQHLNSGAQWFAWAVGLTVLFLLFSSGFFGVLFPGAELGVEAGVFASIFANPSSVAFLIIVALVLGVLWWVFFAEGDENDNPPEQPEGPDT